MAKRKAFALLMGHLLFLVPFLLLLTDTPRAISAGSAVVIVERPSVVHNFSVDDAAVRTMFRDALLEYTKQASMKAAWAKLGVSPQDVVGIKICASGGPVMSSRKPLVAAIAESLEEAGVPFYQVVVWDKLEDDLREAAYLPRPQGAPYSVRSVIPETGFDEHVFYVNEVLGRLIWGDLAFRGIKPGGGEAQRSQKRGEKQSVAQLYGQGVSAGSLENQVSNKSYYARLVTQICTKIINVPVCTDNSAVGFYGSLASLALGMVDNTRRFQGEGNWGDPAIAEILDRPFVRSKVVLHVMDALIAQYAGGPDFSPEYTYPLGAIYLSNDPVAIDSLLVGRVDAWRIGAHIPSLQPMIHYIQTAVEYGLGTSDPKNILLVPLR
ncbi:conserved protein of unknown function [Methylacidimicrobium sp. AP8]|uniref:DUF362 domain-containing protein n=1 Tax=Methylacidimicrobium sp. AP8 TaxID=2730359 RepID=UPI0018BFC47B|nr:DUF362 domain-containing protein [Methylacidimicrobium sp. AP8]CAB4243338.1 conserved protein of unknown function [Methylacidimicrobium sp. AP8]